MVATFILEKESKEDIGKALTVLKKWNQDFSPKYWMTDYSTAEMNALEHCFPGESNILNFPHIMHYRYSRFVNFAAQTVVGGSDHSLS